MPWGVVLMSICIGEVMRLEINSIHRKHKAQITLKKKIISALAEKKEYSKL